MHTIKILLNYKIIVVEKNYIRIINGTGVDEKQVVYFLVKIKNKYCSLLKNKQ